MDNKESIRERKGEGLAFFLKPPIMNDKELEQSAI